MNRRNRTLIVVGLAVILAGLASYGVYRTVQNMPVQEVMVVERQMVVANDMIPAGQLLGPEHVRLTPWPADSPVPGGFETVEDVVGRGVVATFLQNEVITENQLAPRDSGAGLAPMIPEGMRAATIRVNEVSGVAYYIIPGSLVDVLVTVQPEGAREDITRTVLENIKVQAVGPRIDEEQARAEGQPIQTTTVTVLVTPEDGEKLTLAQDKGRVTLALRNPLDTLPVETEGVRVSALVGSPNPAPVRQTSQGRPRMVTPTPPPPPPPPSMNIIRGSARETVEIKRGSGGGARGGGSH